MEPFEQFPFDVGQRVESKSNLRGYRGAWFLSEIKDIQLRKGEVWCLMQYLDFPDEKISYTKAYQGDPLGKKKKVLMIRPWYPLVLHGSDAVANNGSTGSIVVVNGDWKVGDLVDWWADGCYWGATITGLLAGDCIQVELAKTPLGEGGNYEGSIKDIRPSLEWSIEQLWTVPHSNMVPTNAESSDHIYMLRQEPLKYNIIRSISTLSGEKPHTKRKSCDVEASDILGKSCSTGHAPPPCGTRSSNRKLHKENILTGQPQTSGSNLSFQIEPKVEFCSNREHQLLGIENGASELGRLKMDTTRTTRNICNEDFDISLGDIDKLICNVEIVDVDDQRVSSSILALEELVNQIAWLKGVLKLGLSGWSRERKKRNWAIIEKEALPP